MSMNLFILTLSMRRASLKPCPSFQSSYVKYSHLKSVTLQLSRKSSLLTLLICTVHIVARVFHVTSIMGRYWDSKLCSFLYFDFVRKKIILLFYVQNKIKTQIKKLSQSMDQFLSQSLNIANILPRG